MGALTRVLKIVWDNQPPKRYLPRSLDGGTGWGVFDMKLGKFLANSQVKKLTADELMREMPSTFQ